MLQIIGLFLSDSLVMHFNFFFTYLIFAHRLIFIYLAPGFQVLEGTPCFRVLEVLGVLEVEVRSAETV